MKPKIYLLIIFAVSFSLRLSSQPQYDKSVLLNATVNESAPNITLTWNKYPGALNYFIYRKAKNANSWGTAKLNITNGDTSYVDNSITVGSNYEYRVLRTGSVAGNGYLHSGIKHRPALNRGKIIVLVDSTLLPDLDAELNIYLNDLKSEGWIPLFEPISPLMKVAEVKQIIVDLFNDDPNAVKSIFLLGHIPVPYSGNLNPDGHPDHQGAWPSDAFYADINGIWTDNSINSTVASDPRNHNLPNDGKYDQTQNPSAIELEIGRADFNNLPAFADNATELTRAYLNKNHAFRTKEFVPERRGLLQDNFNFAEGFSQSAYKSFSALFGKEKVVIGNYRDDLTNNSYLFSYGCGGGNYVSAGGINSTFNLVTDSLQTVFTMLFGSYFGDWDTQNNFLRSALASGQTLTNAWAGRPNWMFHYMGLGENIGQAAKLTMNNSALYDAGFGANWVHIALMGDPSLRLFGMKKSSNLSAVSTKGHIILEWDAYEEPGEFFTILRRNNAGDPWEELAELPIDQISYVDSCVTQGDYVEYMVRAAQLETSGSGSFYNWSGGTQVGLIPNDAVVPDINLAYNIVKDTVEFIATGNALSYKWSFGDGNTSTELNPDHKYATSGIYTVILTSNFECFSKQDTLIIPFFKTNTNDFSNQIQVLSNKVNNELILLNTSNEAAEYSINDLNGRILAAGNLNKGTSTIKVELLSAGLYVILIKNSIAIPFAVFKQ